MANGVLRAFGKLNPGSLFTALLEAIPQPAALLEQSGSVIAVNSALGELVGSGAGRRGRPFAAALRIQKPQKLGSHLADAAAGQSPDRRRYSGLTPDGHPLCLEIELRAVPFAEALAVVATIYPGEGTEGSALGAKEFERVAQLQGQLDFVERRYRHLATSAGDLVTLHAPDRKLLAVWGNGNIPTERDPALMVGGTLELVVHDEDARNLARAWDAAAFGSEPVAVSYRVQRAPGDWAWVETRILALRDAAGELVELQTVNRDVTEQRSFQHELARLALRDPLTGLANRLLFGDRLRAAVARMARRAGPIAVLLLDVDRFKGVNDSLGHSTGDQLLTELGSRLAGSVRASDTVARLSGDEFAVLAEDLESPTAAELLAERALAALQAPYELEGGFTITVTPSIGVTVSRNPATTPDDLMREADAALYAAKAAGRNRIATFDAPLRQEVRQRLSIDQQARRALADGDLFCVYQPVVDLTDGNVVMAEAFVRLRDEHGQVLAPPDFLPVCEDTGLVLELDRQVIAAVLREISVLRAGATRRCPIVSINLSSRTLTDPRFPDTVASLLEEYGLEGGGLAFELTEPTLPVGGSGVDHTVARLAEMGIGIGLDNFGTGSSALSTLTTLEIDYVKLDGTFLATAAAGPVGLSVNRAVVDLARALGLAVVGQGVETPEHLPLLARLGCTLAQGYALSALMGLDEIPERIPLPRAATG